jgi:hypothetical protein
VQAVLCSFDVTHARVARSRENRDFFVVVGDGTVLGPVGRREEVAMMKAILGSALGGVVAGAVALVASAQSRAPEPAWGTQTPLTSPYAVTASSTAAPVGAAGSVVQCEPHQEAVLQRSFVSGREVAQVTCVPRTLPATYGAAPTTAGYYVPAGDVPAAAVQPDIVQRPAVRRVTQPRTQRVVQREEVKPKRSWKKSALVIGGAAGAGAGVGALAGGKKGALIGAAIGGGSGAIYEVIKRK